MCHPVKHKDCIKYSSIITNVLVTLIGASVFIFCISTRFGSTNQYMRNLLDEPAQTDLDVEEIFILMYVSITISAFVFISGMIGLFGAVYRNLVCLIIFVVATCLNIVGLISVGLVVTVTVELDKLKSRVIGGILDSMQKYNSTTDQKRQYVDDLQTDLSCCGCLNRTDYGVGFKPPSCGEQAKEPCCDKVWSIYYDRFVTISSIAVFALIVEVLALVLASRLIHLGRHKVVRRGKVTFVLDKEIDSQAHDKESHAVKHDGGGAPSPKRNVASSSSKETTKKDRPPQPRDNKKSEQTNRSQNSNSDSKSASKSDSSSKS